MTGGGTERHASPKTADVAPRWRHHSQAQAEQRRFAHTRVSNQGSVEGGCTVSDDPLEAAHTSAIKVCPAPGCLCPSMSTMHACGPGLDGSYEHAQSVTHSPRTGHSATEERAPAATQQRQAHQEAHKHKTHACKRACKKRATRHHPGLRPEWHGNAPESQPPSASEGKRRR